MGFAPKDAKWYLADVIVSISVEGEQCPAVHINTVLVRADSPEEAYQRSLDIGREQEHTYQNTEQKVVSVVFRGLRDLSVIHDDLEHGAELIFREKIVQSEGEIRKFETPKEELSVFAPRVPSTGPNYMPKSIMDELKKQGFSESDCGLKQAQPGATDNPDDAQ